MTSTTYADYALNLSDDDLGAIPINVPYFNHNRERQPREVRSWVRFMRREVTCSLDESLSHWRELAAQHRARGPIWDGLRGDPGEEARAAHLDVTHEVGRMVRAEIERRRAADAGDLMLAAAVAADDLADVTEAQLPERQKIGRQLDRLHKRIRALNAAVEPLQVAAKMAALEAQEWRDAVEARL